MVVSSVWWLLLAHSDQNGAFAHEIRMPNVLVCVCVLETSHSIFHLWKMFPNAIINNNNNKNFMSVISVGPEKWRIDKPNSKIFDTKWLKDKSIEILGSTGEEAKAAKNINILFMMSEIYPQKEQKYGTNVINVMASNLFGLLFVFFFIVGSILRTF